MKKPVARRKGYASGGQIPKGTRTDMWIDRIPVDRYMDAMDGDRKLIKRPPNMSSDDAITTGPQPMPDWMEHSKGGRVKKVIPVVKHRGAR